MYKEVDRCRICGSTELVPILDLGHQYLTGVFPKSLDEKITQGPLELLKCNDESNPRACGLVQLRHSYELSEMYGKNYGYRSGLNRSMVDHLRNKVSQILTLVQPQSGDVVIDIGSNDGTLLSAYPKNEAIFTGIDPTGSKFREYYPSHVDLIPDFFSEDVYRAKFGLKKARIVTSIAMFYDLENPVSFMQQIFNILADDGVWVFEQSYLPTMIQMNAYDTVCHEHLEYYALKQIKWMADQVGLKIIAVELNAINGGSFSITVAKKGSKHQECSDRIQQLLDAEKKEGFSSLGFYGHFRDRVFSHRDALIRTLEDARKAGKKVFGYGASTKGNVILQFCGFTRNDIECIAEVNAEKFGRFTPGTGIPIVSEAEARARKPDIFLALPWHFRTNLLARERDFLQSGGQMLFPLPSLEVVGT